MTPLDRLFALEQFGIKLGLDSTRTLLDALGRPQDAWPAIHIGGTNGKGSTAAMVEAALRAAGHRTGRYTSPHLDRVEERFALDGHPVEPGTLASVVAGVLEEVDRLRRSGRLGAVPTFFEVATVVAFEIFRLARVDVAVIEVGLGGRYDATNVLEPRVTALTSIDFDHEHHLGTTLASIAFEKAGIAKPGVPLILGAAPEEARNVIVSVCEEQQAPLLDVSIDVRTHSKLSDGRGQVTLSTPVRSYPPLTLSLSGRHQVQNATVAVRVLESCAIRGIPVGPSDIVAGLTTAVWPARLEWLRTPKGALLLDAAHNPAGARALAEYLHDVDATPLPIVMAVMEDKNVSAMVRALTSCASVFVATAVPARRCLPAATLADVMRAEAPGTPLDVCDDPDKAVVRALVRHPRAVVAGSIFLVGPLRARLVGHGARSVAHPSVEG
ncbi:MAG: folylpolyglutamate synthase/dihydrofolate synthase family protein [Vicinamibacterales bacterium]